MCFRRRVRSICRLRVPEYVGSVHVVMVSQEAAVRTRGEILAENLIAEGVPHVCGISGQGDMAAFKDRADRIDVVAPRHEHSVAHVADVIDTLARDPQDSAGHWDNQEQGYLA